jgi:hypothetical protein
LYETVEQQLLGALVPGTAVQRYSRMWHLGQVRLEDGIVFGHLGYESASGADIWDEAALDFQEVQVPAGVAAPFGIRLADLLLVFQIRTPDIRVTSFIGALQAILREATLNEDWHIETARQRVPFETWRASVERVTRLRFSLEPPNPNYEGRPDIERLIEGAKVAAATVELRAPDGSVDTDADIVRQLLDHVERGYGDALAVGEREVDGQTETTVYNTKLGGESELVERPADPATGEVTSEVLRRELTDG